MSSSNITITGPHVDRQEEVLTDEALEFIAGIQRTFGSRRDELLELRKQKRAEISRTGTLDFLPETESIRTSDWQVAKAPADLNDRRVEITGPTERKMTINALNSGARVWLADLEDANTPAWENVVSGQINLSDAIREQISFTSPEGKVYELKPTDRKTTIVVRPRGWHFDETHLQVDGKPIVGAFVDFGLYFFHNAKEQLKRGSGPYFYLPKTESHLEARLWNDVFSYAEEKLGIDYGTIRATVLIETITAAFEMEEILYELRDHASGLNAGRWDYLFSIIKNFRDAGPDFTLPDRNVVTMTQPFLKAYAELLVKTCHKHGAFAIGGMAAFIPSRKDAEVNARALEKVREDKTREASAGYDGSWVAHPDLVPVCEEVFTQFLGDKPNQLDKQRPDVDVAAADLIDIKSAEGESTEEGLRGNVSVSIQYLAAWLRGNGAVGINNLMEDAATAEISRSQIWQWLHNGVVLSNGKEVTKELVLQIAQEEQDALRQQFGEEQYVQGRFDEAAQLFLAVAVADEYIDFLTLPAYKKVA